MIKALKKTLGFITQHPLNRNRKLASVIFFTGWQMKSRIFKRDHHMKWIPPLKLSVRNGMAGATGAIYTGLPEFSDMAFVLHFISKNDRFIDVGANVGVYSLMASGLRGASSIAFEPVPTTFEALKRNVDLNRLNEKIELYNMGIGSSKESLRFTKNFDTVNHVIFDDREESITVEVDRLDSLIHLETDQVAVMKIDVEGFEMEVLKGATSLLNDGRLKAVIMEMNGCGEQFGVSDLQLDEKIISFGFEKYHYEPFQRQLIPAEQYNRHGNTIYVRDAEFVRERIKSAPPVKVFKTTF